MRKGAQSKAKELSEFRRLQREFDAALRKVQTTDKRIRKQIVRIEELERKGIRQRTGEKCPYCGKRNTVLKEQIDATHNPTLKGRTVELWHCRNCDRGFRP
jgi:uncharacterized protein with PIN domain